MGEENDNIQNSLDNSGPSTSEIKSEICCNKVSKSKTSNSSTNYNTDKTEVINIPSDSDDDRDYYSDILNLNDNSVMDTVQIVASDIATASSSHLTDETLTELLPNLLNQAPAVASSSNTETTSVNNKIQDESEVIIEDNDNNDIIYMKHVSNNEMKGLLSCPKPECSKESDDTSPKLKDSPINLDELLKDTRLIHALLPRFSFRFIYKALWSNQLAKNRIELTLWDLLPEQRPLPQFPQKRKSLNEMFVECKKSPNASLQKDQVDTKTAVEKKEHVRCTMVDDIGKLEDKTSTLSTDEIDGMKRNLAEVAVLNDTNIDQSNAVPVKKTKLDHTFDTCIERIERDYSLPKKAIVLKQIVQDLKKSVSLEPGSKIEELQSTKNVDQSSATGKILVKRPKSDRTLNECRNILQEAKLLAQHVWDSEKFPEASSKIEKLQSTKNSEAKKKSELLPDNTTTLPVPTVLQPAKLTLQTNFIPSQNETFKPSTPILTPPKLQFIKRNSLPPTAMKMKQVAPITPNINALNLSVNDSFAAARLPSTSSNNKKTSIDGMSLMPFFKPTRLLCSRWIIPQILDISRDMEMEKIKLLNNYTTRVLNKPLYIQPSNSVETSQNKDHSDQRRPNKRRIHKFNQETGAASTSQQYLPYEHDLAIGFTKQNTMTNIIQKDIDCIDIDNPDYNEVNINISKESKPIKIDVEHKNIALNERANEIFVKILPMFPSIRTSYIKQLCQDYVRDYKEYNDEALLGNLIDILLTGQDNLEQKLKPKEIPALKELNPTYDVNEQYADLLTIFPEADPVYLRKIAEETNGDYERIKDFVQSKLENPDYPTRAQYLAKKKITEQQKQYTTDFQVQQFLEMFPNPFSYFEDDKRNCQFNPHAIDFLKYNFSKLRVNTLVKTYSKYNNNLSLTAKELEALNPDLKTKRHSNKMILTEDIPFLQECAFIQHKAELNKYLEKVKAKEEQEFDELKAKNELLECQCCYDNECMPSKCSTCADGHIFCNLCIIRSTDVVLGDGNTRVDCLLKCGCEFPLSVLQQVLPPTKFSILLCKRQEAEVMAAGVEGLVSCPFCHFASIPPPEDKIFKCLNPECMKESCRFCKELNHVPLKCNEKKAESARLYLEEKMTEALVRKCYRCSRIFFKEEGCNKMTCICGAQMCYICDKPVTDYKHFQGQGAERSNLCPLWSDDRRRNAESVIKVCQETVKQIKEKNPNIDINVNALLPKLPPKSKGPHDNIMNNVMIHNRMDARQFPFG